MATSAKPEPISEDLLLAVYQSLLRYWIKQGVSKEKAEDLAQESGVGVERVVEGLGKTAKQLRDFARDQDTPFVEVVIGIIRGRSRVSTNSKLMRVVTSGASTEA